MKDAKEDSPRFDDLQPRLPRNLERLPVPMTAELSRMAIVPPVLPATDPLAITSSVFNEQNAPISPANPCHLFQRRHRVGERARRQSGNNRIEASVTKAERLGIHPQERHS